MNRHEKIALYNLAVIGASFLCFAILFFITRQSHPLETSFRIASSALGILGFLGFSQTLFQKKGKGKRKVGFFDPELDERDIQIYRRAGLHAFSTLWGLCVLAIMGVWIYFRWKQGIEGPVTILLNVDLLPLSLMASFGLIMLVYSLSILRQQRSGTVSEGGGVVPFVPNTRSLAWSLFMLPVAILFGLFFVFQGDVLFGVLFVTVGFGASALTIREIRRKQAYLENGTTTPRIILLARIINVIFTLMFAGLVIIFMKIRVGSGPELRFELASLFVLIFIALIFIRTIIADLKQYLRGRRHEKT
jgi:hypothetical protein